MNDPRDLPRVPHATEDGLQQGRPHPALRRYQANYRVVDWAEGLKLMANRRSGKEPLIKGGVDDGSPEMELKGAVLPDPFSKMRIDPKEPVLPPPIAGGKRKAPTRSPGPEPNVANPYPSREELLSSKPGSVEGMAGHLDPFSPSDKDEEIPSNAVMPKFAEPVAAPPAPAPVREQDDRYDALRARYDSEVERARPVSEYLSGRMRVEIELDSMSFSLSVVDVIESSYGVVVLMPSGGDSMTFMPRPMSNARVSCQKKGVSADVAYMGVSFEIEPLGLLGLAFVKRKGERKESVSALVDKLKNA